MAVAVLGFGTVGQGIWEMLPEEERGLVLVRPGKEDAPWKCGSLDDILADESITVVAEAMGGTDPAFSYARRILESGRSFVTANKVLVAAHGIELAALARSHGAAFLFSAACGGGVPFLHNLGRAVNSGDEVFSFAGILNGTTNFILDAMQRFGKDYDEVLKEAQALGYAEADPTADVSGMDALRKVLLGCAVGFSVLPQGGALCEGIESFTSADVRSLQSLGRCCRLIGSGGRAEGGVYALVEPTVFPAAAVEASVQRNLNLARYTARRAGDITLIGQGAGRYPTASAVLRDIRGISEGETIMLPADCRAADADCGGLLRRYYVRCGAETAALLPEAERFDSEEGAVRLLTQPMSAETMHKTAAERRQAGEKLFFAAWEDTEC